MNHVIPMFTKICAVVLGSFLSLTGFAGEPDAEWVSRNIKVMVDQEATFKDRCEAEDQLRTRPSAAYVSRLLPLLDKFASDPRCGTGRAHESELSGRKGSEGWPVALQIDHAVNRLWLYTLENGDRATVGGEIVRLLQLSRQKAPVRKDRRQEEHGQAILLEALNKQWIDSAEPVVRMIYEDRTQPGWWTALKVMAVNAKLPLRDELHQLIDHSELDSYYQDLLFLVGSKPYTDRWGKDNYFLNSGFRKLQNLPLSDRSQVLHALNLVIALQQLAGETFLEPFSYSGDERDEVVTARRIKGEFAAIERAKAWWAERTDH